MDKLRNILSPGHAHDDEVLYGSGKSDDPIMSKNEDLGKLSGQGTHFGHSRSAEEQDPSMTTGTGPTTTGNAASNPLSSQQLRQDDGESTASIKSGVAGYPQGSSGLTDTSGMQGDSTSYRDENINPSSTTGTHPSESAYQTGNVGDSTGVGAEDLSTSERPSEQQRQEGIADIGETTKDRSYPLGGSRTEEAPLTDNADPKVQTKPLSEAYQQRRDGDLTGGAKPQSEDHHYGRDAGLAGGAGAAGLGTYEATRDKSSDNPLSSSRPAGDSGIGSDSRGQGYGTQESTQPSTSTDKNPTSRMPGAFQQDQPIGSTQKDHHYGRDAGLAGAGAGALGVGAYEADKHHQESGYEQTGATGGTTTGTTGPASSYNQPSDTTGTSAGYIPGTDARGHDAPSTGTALGGITDAPQGYQSQEHHYGRDAGVAAGLGAGGAGTYGLSKHEDKPLPDTPQTMDQRGTTTSTQPTEDPNLNKDTDHHYGRDAGIAAAGVGAGAYGAHEHSQHRDEEAERQRMKDEEARRKEQQKEMEKQQKAHEKAVVKEEKKHEKAIAKEERKEEKKHEKEEAAVLAAREKEQRRQQERYEKEQGSTGGALAGTESEKELEREDSKEKKGGLLAFLHRKKDPESKELEREEDSSHKKEAGLGAAGIAGAGGAAYEYEKHHHPAEEPYDLTTGTSGTTGRGGVEDRVHEKMTTDPSHQSAGATTGTTAGTMAGTTAGTTTDPYSSTGTTTGTSTDPYSSTGTTSDPTHRGLDTTSTDASQPGGFSNEGVTGSSNVPSSTQGRYDQHGSHRGAETAAGLGAAGALGAGAYGAEKHHERKDGYGQTDSTPSTEATTTASGHHHGNVDNTSTSGSDPAGYVRGHDGVLRMKPDAQGHSHHGTEAAAGLGAGGLGAGAYEANRHHQERDGYDQTGAKSTLEGGDVSSHGQSDQSSSHRGAETAAGLGAMGAGAGTYAAHKHHNDDASYDRSGSTGGTEFGSRQEYDNVQQGSHGGARTVAGAGAVGAGGVGYEAEKHHHDRDDDRTKSGRNVLTKDPPQGYQDSRQGHDTYGTDRDTDSHGHRGAETAGGLGVVGASAYGADKLHDNREAEREPTNTTGYSHPGKNLSPGDIGTSGTQGYADDRSSSMVTEPRTGLPMDLSKGTGAHETGGTDGTTPVPHRDY